MSNNCPVYLNPFEYAKRGMRIEGQILVDEFKRLAGLVSKDCLKNDISVDLQFDINSTYEHCIMGSIKGIIVAECQRCLNSMDYGIDILVNHILCSNDDCLDKHKKNETIFSDENKKLRLADLLEDELLLAIPFAPMHQKMKDCQGIEKYIQGIDVEEEIIEKVPSPFSGLKDQLNLG